MSDDIASLRINIRSLEAQVAQQRLDGLTRSGSRAETSTNSLTKAFVKFAGPAALAAGAVYGLSQIVSVTREFDVLNAQLITATGSAENAGRAFEAIQQFATETPYDLAQATEGFTKLVNLGLTPSEKALKSYGDTASAMGKDLIQLVEAVADASTGEFERLKEFGIKTKKNGDDIAFTFRGVTTSVKNNSEEIESYLIALGENNFAGAMEQRIATLDGAFSNFGDAWNKMVLTISQTGIGDAIEDGVRLGTEALEEMTTLVASGQLQGYLSAIAGQFSGFGGAAADAFDYISGIWADVPSEWKTNAGLAVDAFINALKHLPIEVESLIKLAAVELAVFVDYAGIYGKLAVDAMFAYFGAGVERAKVYGKAIAEALDPRTDYDLDGELAKIDARFTTTTDTALAAARNRAEVSAQVRRDVITGIIDERRAAIESFDVQIEKADSLRSSWDEIQLAKKNATGDRLAEFKITPDKTEERCSYSF